MLIDTAKLEKEIAENIDPNSFFCGTRLLLGHLKGYDLILNITRSEEEMLSLDMEDENWQDECIVTEN